MFVMSSAAEPRVIRHRHGVTLQFQRAAGELVGVQMTDEQLRSLVSSGMLALGLEPLDGVVVSDAVGDALYRDGRGPKAVR